MKKQLRTPIPLSIIEEVRIESEFEFYIKRIDGIINNIKYLDNHIHFYNVDIYKKRKYYENLDELCNISDKLNGFIDKLVFRYESPDF